MEEIDKNVILNKYLNNTKTYDKYFNSLFKIGYYIYKNINYNDICIIGGALYYMLYKNYKINKKYFKYFQTLDIDIISIYEDLSCLYNKKIKISIRDQIIEDLKKTIENDYIRKHIKIIDNLLNGNNNYIIKIKFKYHNTSSIKIQLIYQNDEVCFHFIDFLIDSKISINTNRYQYMNKYFIGENLLSSCLYLLCPIGYFWSNVSKGFYQNLYVSKKDVYSHISCILSDNPILYFKYVKNFIRTKMLYDIFLDNPEFLLLNDIQISTIKSIIYILRSNFVRYLLPNRYNESNFLKKKTNLDSKTIDYLTFVLKIYLYLNKKIVNHQEINDDYCVYINIKTQSNIFEKLFRKKKIVYNNRTYLNNILQEFNNQEFIYTPNTKDDNPLCNNKLQYLESYL